MAFGLALLSHSPDLRKTKNQVIFQNQKRSKLNEITKIVLLCRDQLKITTDRIMAGPGTQTPAFTSAPSQSLDFASPRPGGGQGEKSAESQQRELTEAQNAETTENLEAANLNNSCNTGDDPLLIFSEDNLKQLQTRTEELKTERAMQKNKFKDDRQAYLNLQSDCKVLNSKIDKLDGQCSIEMVKRFGEGVSMQDIESFAVNRTLEEMKESSKRKEQSLYDGIQDVKVYTRFLFFFRVVA